jgi:hypothetical protein
MDREHKKNNKDKQKGTSLKLTTTTICFAVILIFGIFSSVDMQTSFAEEDDKEEIKLEENGSKASDSNSEEIDPDNESLNSENLLGVKLKQEPQDIETAAKKKSIAATFFDSGIITETNELQKSGSSTLDQQLDASLLNQEPKFDSSKCSHSKDYPMSDPCFKYLREHCDEEIAPGVSAYSGGKGPCSVQIFPDDRVPNDDCEIDPNDPDGMPLGQINEGVPKCCYIDISQCDTSHLPPVGAKPRPPHCFMDVEGGCVSNTDVCTLNRGACSAAGSSGREGTGDGEGEGTGDGEGEDETKGNEEGTDSGSGGGTTDLWNKMSELPSTNQPNGGSSEPPIKLPDWTKKFFYNGGMPSLGQPNPANDDFSGTHIGGVCIGKGCGRDPPPQPPLSPRPSP